MSRDSDLQEILECCKAATEGPWHAVASTAWYGMAQAVVGHGGTIVEATVPMMESNAKFIARARADLPAVVEELLEARELLRRWTATPRLHNAPEMLRRTLEFLGEEE